MIKGSPRTHSHESSPRTHFHEQFRRIPRYVPDSRIDKLLEKLSVEKAEDNTDSKKKSHHFHLPHILHFHHSEHHKADSGTDELKREEVEGSTEAKKKSHHFHLPSFLHSHHLKDPNIPEVFAAAIKNAETEYRASLAISVESIKESIDAVFKKTMATGPDLPSQAEIVEKQKFRIHNAVEHSGAILNPIRYHLGIGLRALEDVLIKEKRTTIPEFTRFVLIKLRQMHAICERYHSNEGSPLNDLLGVITSAGDDESYGQQFTKALCTLINRNNLHDAEVAINRLYKLESYTFEQEIKNIEAEKQEIQRPSGRPIHMRLKCADFKHLTGDEIANSYYRSGPAYVHFIVSPNVIGTSNDIHSFFKITISNILRLIQNQVESPEDKDEKEYSAFFNNDPCRCRNPLLAGSMHVVNEVFKQFKSATNFGSCGLKARGIPNTMQLEMKAYAHEMHQGIVHVVVTRKRKLLDEADNLTGVLTLKADMTLKNSPVGTKAEEGEGKDLLIQETEGKSLEKSKRKGLKHKGGKKASKEHAEVQHKGKKRVSKEAAEVEKGAEQEEAEVEHRAEGEVAQEETGVIDILCYASILPMRKDLVSVFEKSLQDNPEFLEESGN